MPPKAKAKATGRTAADLLTLPHPITGEPATFRLHEVDGDGHCFFRALACALSGFQQCSKRAQEMDEIYKTLRQDAIDAVRDCTVMTQEDKTRAVARLSKGAKARSRHIDRWVEDLEIGPLARQLRKRIHIYENKPTEPWIELGFHESRYGDPDVFLYNPSNIHYDALELLDASQAPPSTAPSTTLTAARKRPMAPDVDELIEAVDRAGAATNAELETVTSGIQELINMRNGTNDSDLLTWIDSELVTELTTRQTLLEKQIANIKTKISHFDEKYVALESLGTADPEVLQVTQDQDKNRQLELKLEALLRETVELIRNARFDML